MTARSFWLAAAAAAAGCAAPGPAPVELRGAQGFEAAGRGATAAQRAAPIETRAPAARPHPASPPPDWAEGPGVPLSAWALQPEDAQPFDPANPPPAHTVAPGETLYTLSARYQIPLRALIEHNRLSAPFRLEEGQVLALPAPRLHVVKKGDTLSGLGVRYNIDARSLALLNRLEAPYAIRAGDKLVLPALARAPAVAEAPVAAPAGKAGAQAQSTGPTAKASPASPPPPPPAAKPSFKLAWPLRGKILTKFGALPGGKRSEGVDIAGPAGAPIKAAADGVVVYAGDDLPGYGNLMLVQHAGGWVTAYAQARSLKKAPGAKVKLGEVIAEVGGDGPLGARLHFQIRRGVDPTDPTALLGPISAL